MKKIKSLFLFSGLVYIIFLLMGYFDEIRPCIICAAKMWATVLLPSLFPYLIISQYVSQSGILSVMYPIQRLVSALFNICYESAGIYICSLISGYPSGALCTSQLQKEGVIEFEEAKRLICFTNNPSPIFLISAVGGCMLGSVKDGIAIYTIQTIAAAMWGVGSGLKNPKSAKNIKKSTMCSVSFTDCCSKAVTTILEIGGYIIIAAAAGKIILISLEKGAIGNNLTNSMIVYSFLEISNGMKALSPLASNPICFGVMCACASWGGISVILQIASASPKGISFKKIVSSKAIQSILSLFMGYAYRCAAAPRNFEAHTDGIFLALLIICACIFGIYAISVHS